jgi:prolyl-tRNA synthetase
MVTGANENDWHLRGVDVERDIPVAKWLDIRMVEAGESCPVCGGVLAVQRMIEVGHIFKLGTKFSLAVGASVLDEDGAERPILMGSYGIGIGRNMAAVIENHHDEKGIVWPMTLAPYEVVITALKVDDAATMAAAEEIYRALRDDGVDVMLDDRDERPGVKFNDAELIGFPLRITVGPRGLSSGQVELTNRATGETEIVPMAEVAAVVAAQVASAKA